MFILSRDNYVNGDIVEDYYIQTGIDKLNITTDYEVGAVIIYKQIFYLLFVHA